MNGPCYIQNRAVMNRVIKRSRCILLKIFKGTITKTCPCNKYTENFKVGKIENF